MIMARRHVQVHEMPYFIPMGYFKSRKMKLKNVNLFVKTTIKPRLDEHY